MMRPITSRYKFGSISIFFAMPVFAFSISFAGLATALVENDDPINNNIHIDIVVYDPSMIKQDGTYYLFNTGDGIANWSSDDMENWERLDPVFAEAPEWAERVVPDFGNHIWAPSISYHDGTYYLYYSISSFGRNNSAIGLATNQTLHPEDPGFEWVDQGIVVESVPGRDMWNGYYNNFVSWDVCCRGEDSTYKIVVGRSENVTGPYLDKEGQDMRHGGGSLVLQGNEDYAGIGHNAAYTFDGVDYLIAHAYDLSDERRSKLLIREMTWDENGWPKVSLE